MADKKKTAKGKLPSKKWLLKHGYRGLIDCMKKHPELFAHIEQEDDTAAAGGAENSKCS